MATRSLSTSILRVGRVDSGSSLRIARTVRSPRDAPHSRVDLRHHGPMATPSTNGTQPYVLVVDDEEHISEMVAMGLGFNGFEVDRAASGRGALDAIANKLIQQIQPIKTALAQRLNNPS